MKQKLCGIVLGAVLAACLLAAVQPGTVQAQTSGSIREQIDALEAEGTQLEDKIRELEQSLLENAEKTEELVARKGQIDEQIFLLYEQIGNTDSRIAAYGLLVADSQEELEQAEAELAQLRQVHKERLRAMEERGELSYWSVLLEASSMSDFLDKLTMLREIMASDNKRLQQLQTAAAEVEAIRTELEKEKAELEALRQDQELTWQSLQEKRAAADTLLQELMIREDTFTQLMLESEDRQEALMAQIAQKENEYDQLAYQEWLATSVPETTVPETTAAPEVPEETETDQVTQPQWLTPVPYYTLTSPFGMRLHPILGIYRMHNGVDLSCAQGTPIYATRSGIVSITDYEENGAGNYVQINHGDGYRSVYMHMTHYIVSLGEHVEAGQIIGYVGSTGLSDGPHLHFGISYNGTYRNPMEYID